MNRKKREEGQQNKTRKNSQRTTTKIGTSGIIILMFP